ncbi:MAG: hypothetical protein IJV04_01350, partial [Lachnospiraceae bacterium]|nr:hypothetical protein [Lachnospiraceae bacterium]
AFLVLSELSELLEDTEVPLEEFLIQVQASLNQDNLFLIVIGVFLSVYFDDVKSGALPSVIGIGISRGRFLIAKLVDCAILVSIQFFLVWTMKVSLMLFAMKLPMSQHQVVLLAIYGFLCIIHALGVLAITELLYLLTESTAAAVISLFLLSLIMPFLLETLQSLTSLEIYEISMSGMLQQAYVAFTVDGVPWQLLPVIGGPIIGVTLVSIGIFQKKELEL